MSNQHDLIAQGNIPSAQIIVDRERVECLRCNSVIPNHLVRKNLMGLRDLGPTRQKVLAKCPHCNILYKIVRELRDGGYVGVGNCEVVTDRNQIASFDRVTDQLTGDKQIA